MTQLTTAAALDTVTELLLGEDSIPVQLRMRDGLHQERFERLVAAIEHLIEAHREQDSVPKALALAFVDVGNAFFYPEGTYPEVELERIEDAGIRLGELASELFGSSSR